MSDVKTNFWENTFVNIITNVARTVVMALVGVLLVPYYIDTLGLATYGIIPLATAMTSYIMIVSDSLVAACSRYTVIAIQREDQREMNVAFNTALFGIGKNVLMLIPVIVLFSLISPYIFQISDNAILDVQLMFLLILLSAAIVTFTTAFNSIFSAFNKVYIFYIARILYTVIQVLIIILMFSFTTPSLIDIGIAYVVSAVVMFVIVYYFAMRTQPSVRVSRSLYDSNVYRNMGTLGVWTIVVKVGNLLFIQTSLILSNIFFGSEVEGGFAIVVSLISMTNTACYSIVTAMEPLIYRCYSEGDNEKLVSVATTMMRFVGLTFAMPIAFVLIFPDVILSTWVGEEYVYLSDLIRIGFVSELLFCVVAVVANVPLTYLKMDILAKYTLVFGIINVVLASLCSVITNFNIQGITAIWAITIACLSLYTVIFDAKITSTRKSIFIKPIVESYLALAISTGLLYILSDYISISPNWISLMLVFLSMFVVYFAIVMVILPKKDKYVLETFLPSKFKPLLFIRK